MQKAMDVVDIVCANFLQLWFLFSLFIFFLQIFRFCKSFFKHVSPFSVFFPRFPTIFAYFFVLIVQVQSHRLQAELKDDDVRGNWAEILLPLETWNKKVLIKFFSKDLSTVLKSLLAGLFGENIYYNVTFKKVAKIYSQNKIWSV